MFMIKDIMISRLDTKQVVFFLEWLRDNIESWNYKITGYDEESIGFKMYREEDVNLLRLQVSKEIRMVIFDVLK